MLTFWYVAFQTFFFVKLYYTHIFLLMYLLT